MSRGKCYNFNFKTIRICFRSGTRLEKQIAQARSVMTYVYGALEVYGLRYGEERVWQGFSLGFDASVERVN